MSQAKFIPTSDSDKVVWLNNFTTKMSLYATPLGVTTAELTALQKDNAYFSYLISMMEVYRQNLLNLAGYKNMLKRAVGQQHIGALPALPTLPAAPPAVSEGVFDRVSKLVARIKASLNYSDNIGSDLGVISPTETIDVTTMQPEIKINLEVGKPHLKWKKGYSDAIDLYGDHNDGQGFVFIGRFTRNEYLDITPLATGKVFDEWSYKAIYVIADVQVGLYSKVTSVDVKKM
ncbi:MAG: hypothetical protein K0S53_815 [Bacteroidetes bacterium]|jgi:hypothetical protein|nr:hypothetical protein [Bacteroidota bacterium]